MNIWKTALCSAALLAAAAIAAGVAWSPLAEGQTRSGPPRPAEAPRSLEILGGRQAHIGVSVKDPEASELTAAGLGAPGGVLIDEVRSDSPAEKAGFRAGDIVTEFDGERVRSARQFTRLVQETPPGRQVAATVLRGRERLTLNVEPAEGGLRVFGELGELGRRFHLEIPPAPDAPPPPDAPRAPRIPDLDWVFGGDGRLGVSVDNLTPQLAEYFGAKEGVLVRSVSDGSSAARAGLRAGDVIVGVNGEPVARAEDLRRAVRRLESGAAYELQVLRDRKPLTLKGEVEERRDRRRRTTTAGWRQAPAALALRPAGGPTSVAS